MSQLVQVQSGKTNVRLPDRVMHGSLEKVILTDSEFDGLATGPFTSFLTDLGPGILSAVVSLSTVVDNGQIVAQWVPGFRGEIRNISAIVTTAVTTGSKLATFSLKIDQGVGTSEVNTLTITGVPTGGTFTVTVNAQTTTGVAFNATAATLQTALEALSNVSPGDVVVTGSAGGPYTITWGGILAETNVTITSSGAGLTGGTTPAATLTTPTQGAPDSDALVALSGGAIALTSANATPIGKALVGTNVKYASNGSNQFGVNSVIRLVASGVTAFSEGVVVFLVTLDPSSKRLVIN
jgi:hypothetical protein